MKPAKNTLRNWLIINGYEDIARLIDEILVEWKLSGNKQRRNWWDILAGDKNGNSRVIAGRTIPVLKVAQIRKGVKITDNAISYNIDETPISINPKNRWNQNTET